MMGIDNRGLSPKKESQEQKGDRPKKKEDGMFGTAGRGRVRMRSLAPSVWHSHS